MTPFQNLQYAVGELAYIIGRSDWKIDPEEDNCFHEMVARDLRRTCHEFKVHSITSKEMRGSRMDTESAYQWAMMDIKAHGRVLNPVLKDCFVAVLEKIAKSFPPVTQAEKEIIKRFKADIQEVC